MTIFTSRKNSTGALSKDGSTPEKLTQKISKNKKRMRGNIFFALFAAVAMVGAVGYGFNTVIRGPISSMSDVTRRTVTENFVITASRVAIVNATTQQANAGDCDADGMIEPLPWRDPAGAPAPTGGGLIPLDLVPDVTDPWKTQYGYCAWDTGSLSVSNAVAGCGGATPRRLQGSPFNNQYAIAVISAGKDRKFDTRCNAYVDTTPADSLPDTPLLVKTQGSDDIVLGYTYAEANDLGNGLWKEKALDPTTLQTDKSVESTGGATFADKVVLTGNTVTGGGLVLPGDPGDNSLSGPCDSAANDRQMRLNNSTTPPTLEICNWDGGAGLGWTPVSGGAGGGGPADCTGLGDAFYNDPVSGHCYYEYQSPYNHPDALAACAGDGNYMVSIDSGTENSLIDAQFGQTWIAVTDESTEGDWVYTAGPKLGQSMWSGDGSGSPVGGNFNAWYPGEPNDLVGAENCAALAGGGWIDTSCPGFYDPVCEKTGSPSGGGGGSGSGDLTSGLIHHWKLDETSGTTVADSGSNPMNGTYAAGITSVPGKQGTAFDVNLNQAIVTGDEDMNVGESFTVSFWLNDEVGDVGNAGDGWRTIIDKGDASNASNYYVQVGDWDRLVAGVENPQYNWHEYRSVDQDVTRGTWKHVTVAYTIGTASSMKMWVDGQPIAGAWEGGSNGNAAPTISNAPLRLATSLNGVVDDIRMYDRILSNTDVEQLYACTGGTGTCSSSLTANVPSPVSRWKMNETSGTTVSDSVGGRNGTFNNTPVWEPTGGANGGSLRTAQTGAHTASVPRSAALEPTAITLVAWAKPTSFPGGGWATIVQKAYQNNTVAPYASYSFGTDATYGNRIGWGPGTATPGGNVYSTNAPPLNTWTHIAGTYDPNGPAPQVKLYINGVLESTNTWTAPIVYDTSSPGGDFHFGRESTASAEVWRGSIDDVRIYNKALTASQIQNIYNSTKPPAQVLTSPNRAGKLFGSGLDSSGAQGNGVGALNTNSFYALPGGDNFVYVAAGSGTSCGIKAEGTLWCWGDDTNGQLGDGGTNTNKEVLTQLTGITDAVKVQIHFMGGCVLRKNGQLMCWGTNTGGALGTGSATPATSTVPVEATAGPNDYIDFAISRSSGGGTSVCALRSSGSVICWGEGSNGELGNGANNDSLTPVTVSNLTNFMQITSTGGTLGTGGRFCGVTKTGDAYCWGRELADEFGNGGTNNAIYNVPTLVSTYSDWAKIVAGDRYTCGIRANGQAFCWGQDSSSQLGDGGAAVAMVVPTATNTSARFTDIFLGTSSTCAISTTRELYCWGSNASGQLGGGPSMAGVSGSPIRTNGRNVIHAAMGVSTFMIMDEAATDAVVADKGNLIASGNAHWCSIIKDGALVCAGDDTNGELGNGVITGNQTSPTGITEPGPWMQVSTNPTSAFGHTCAIKGDGTAWCWGEGSTGEMGNGATTDQVSPVRVSGGATRQWSQVAVGDAFACGIETDSDLYCWGAGLGATPVLMNFGKTWSKISAGDNNMCGIANDGNIWCWGEDALGELGNGSATTSSQANPVQVSSSGPWVDVSAGPISCGIKSNGSLWCWGDLATANITGWGNTVPQLMMDIGPWVKVKSNRQSACAIKANGSLWCFGEGGLYMLGQGVTTDYTYPVPIKGGGTYIDLSVSYDHACGMRSDNMVYCWGNTVTLPSRADLSPARAPWAWNAADNALLAAPGLSSTIGTSRWISDDGAANKGFNFAGSGRSQIRQTAAGNQLFIDTKGASLDAQATLRAPSALVASDVTDGLVRYFKLDNTTGASMTDTQGVGAGTWTDGSGNVVTQETQPGINGTALRFDGTNDRIIVPDHASLDVTQVTLSAWIKAPTAISGIHKSIAHRSINASGLDVYGLFITDNADGQQFVFILNTGNGEFTSSSGKYANAYTNQWVHLVGTYDGHHLRTYVNGVFTDSTPATGDIVADSTPFTIGAGYQVGVLDEFFPGLIDDVRLYNRALDPGEVSQLYYYTSQYAVTRSMGADSSTGNFKITRNNSAGDAWLSTLPNDLEINTAGNVGIGTAGYPASKLDVNGAIKVGNEATCNGAAEGTIRWTGTAMEYCDGTWQPLTSNQGGGGSGNAIWNIGNFVPGPIALAGNGSAWAYGIGASGRLGNNQGTIDAYVPAAVQVHSDASNTGWQDWISLSSSWTSCGIRAAGSAWCWGYGDYGQIGNNNNVNQYRPVRVGTAGTSTLWSDWKYVEPGVDATCGIRVNGAAYCWGRGDRAMIGNGGTSDVLVPTIVHDSDGAATAPTNWTDWKFVEAEQWIAAGLRANGGAYTWGDNTYGLGFIPASATLQTRPQLVKGVGGIAGYTDWKDISASVVTLCGIRANGQMYCWGNGSSGQLGDGFPSTSDYPKRTLDTDCTSSSTNWVDVDTSEYHACAIKAGGTLWCWGRAAEGQSGNDDFGGGGGDGNNGNNYCMHQVLSDTGGGGWSDWVSVSADFNFTCGSRANGTTWCWGDGTSPTGSTSGLPVQVRQE